MFKNNICGGLPKIPYDMPDSANPLPPEFFVNPRYPPTLAAVEAKDAEANHGRVVEDSERGFVVKELGFLSYVSFIYFG